MTNEQTPETVTPDVSAIPEDFNEYEAWRRESTKETPSDSSANVSTDESGAASETAIETEEDTSEEKPELKKKGGFKKRISKLTGRIADLERQLAGSAPAAKSGDEATKQETNAAAKVEADAYTVPKPELKDCVSVEEFADKLTDWKLEKKDHERNAAERASKVQSEQKQLVETWQTRQAEAKGRFADYDDALASVEDIKLSADLQSLFLDSEHGPELAYHLAKHRSELERIAKLAPLAAAKAIGSIEAQLSKETSPKETKKQVTSAPKPVQPISGGKASTTLSVYDSTLAEDFGAWEKLRNAELRNR
jgi:hypothetical protein